MKPSRLFIAFCLLPGTQVFAHGYVIYASTPVSPPLELRWWLPLSLVILWVATTFCLQRVLEQSRRAAVLRAFCVVVLFAVSFFVFGSCVSMACTAPLPGLGPPSPMYRGLGWGSHMVPFLVWNAIGILFFLKSMLFIGRASLTGEKRRNLLRMGATAYCATLVPYLISGAYIHGWAGGHIDLACMARIDRLTEATCDYADAHDGRLPTAANIDELLQVVRPYLKQSGSSAWTSAQPACPEEEAFEREPQKYRWNVQVSGQRLADLDRERLKTDGLIACPRHQRQGLMSARIVAKHLEHSVPQPTSAPTSASQPI